MYIAAIYKRMKVGYICIENNKGPKIEPCGTPNLRGKGLEIPDFKETLKKIT